MRINERVAILLENLGDQKTYRLDPTAPPFSVKPPKPSGQQKPATQQKPVKATPQPARHAPGAPGSKSSQSANRTRPASRGDHARQKANAGRDVQAGMAAEADMEDIEAEVYVAALLERKNERRRQSNPEQCGDTSPAADMELDLVSIRMEQLTDSSGVFEILLPGGKIMGVVVDRSVSNTRFLLSPSDEKQRERLLRHQMELENRLARRIGTDVRITVL